MTRWIEAWFCILIALPAAFLLASGCRSTGPTGASPVRPVEASVGGPASEEARVRAQQLLIRALTSSRLGEHREAIQLLNDATLLVPGEPALLAALADAHRGAGDMATARYYLEAAVAGSPGSPELLLELGDLLNEAGFYDDAVEAYEHAGRASSDERRVLIKLGDAQENSGRFADAIRTYERLIDAGGPEENLRRRMHRLYMSAADDAGAERNLEEYLRLRPSDDDARAQLARLYEARGALDSASMLLQEAGVQSPPVTPFDSSDVPDATPALAREETEEATQPHRAPASDVHKAERLEQSFRFDEAAAAYRAILEEDPRRLDLWPRLARLLTRAGRADEALEVAEEGLFLFPGQSMLLLASSEAALHLSQHSVAEERLQEALQNAREAGPIATDMLLLAAELYASLDADRADSLLIVAAGRDEPLAIAARALFLARSGRSREAARLTRRLDERRETEALHARGQVLVLAGDEEEGVRLLQEAAERPDAGGRVFEDLSKALRLVGRTMDADAAAREGLRREPGNMTLRQTLSLP